MSLSELKRRVLVDLRRLWLYAARRRPPDAKVRSFLEEFYGPDDTWNMAGETEQFRFRETTRVLREELLGPTGRVVSLLEIGCGEGHQSEHLLPLCEHYTGIDIVGSAVERARRRLPHAEFVLRDLEAQPWAQETGRFDIVTAFEVLQYFPDIRRTVATMSRLGRACALTYHSPAAPLVEHILRAIPGVQGTSFEINDTKWYAAWWRSGSLRLRPAARPAADAAPPAGNGSPS